MEKVLGYDKISLDSSKVKMEETEDHIIFRDVVIAREIVQPYDINGKKMFAYKSADELEACAWTADGQWIQMDTHPTNLVIDRRENVHGQMRNPRFRKDLKDPKTRRPNQRGVLTDLWFFKKQIPANKQDDLRALNEKDSKGKNRDVSIGFFYTPVVEDGTWNGAHYDFRQTDILLNHLAAPIPAGRCAMPYCGIGADEVVLRMVCGAPEETDNLVIIPVLDKNSFVADSFKSVTLSSNRGVTVVFGKLKSDPDGCSVMHKVDFLKNAGWDMEKAKFWVSENKDEAYRIMKDTLLTELLPPGELRDFLAQSISFYETAKDLSLEEIESKINALKKQRDEIQGKIQKWYEDNPPQDMPKELDDLYDALHDLDMELRAYYEAKVKKIAGESQDGQDENAWVKAIDWRKNPAAFDALPEKLQDVIVTMGLCPDCPDDTLEDDGEEKTETASGKEPETNKTTDDKKPAPETTKDKKPEEKTSKTQTYDTRELLAHPDLFDS